MSDDIEDLLARMKPSGVEPELRPRVLDAVAAELGATRGETTPCSDPAGHQFVCVHCGSVARPASRVRRWATATALAAMTCAAAVLFIMRVNDHQDQVVERNVGRVSQPSQAGQTVLPASGSGESASNLSFLSRRRLPNRAEGRWILSAADMELPDERPVFAGLPPNHGAPTLDIEAADARMSNAALLNKLLNRSTGGAIGQKD